VLEVALEVMLKGVLDSALSLDGGELDAIESNEVDLGKIESNGIDIVLHIHWVLLIHKTKFAGAQ
jgi:hypothetical protein